MESQQIYIFISRSITLYLSCCSARLNGVFFYSAELAWSRAGTNYHRFLGPHGLLGLERGILPACKTMGQTWGRGRSARRTPGHQFSSYRSRSTLVGAPLQIKTISGSFRQQFDCKCLTSRGIDSLSCSCGK